MPRGPGFFQLNDIVLDIPPEQIQVNRRSVNHQWQTLRTKSSIKVKSGYSQLDIALTAYFTDTTQSGEIFNGLQKLRDLVSQFRVTPFCYVQNSFLRDSILSGDTNQTMALALRQLEISTLPESTNTVRVTMNFSWFNYFPYTPSFSFKKEIFVSQEVRDPRQSNAWKLMYQSEQKREEWGFSKQIKHLQDGGNFFQFKQWATLHLKQYETLKAEVGALQSLKAYLESRHSGSGVHEGQLQADVISHLKETLQDFRHAASLTEETFGQATSMTTGTPAQEQAVISELLRLIDKNISSGTESKYSVVVDKDTFWEAAQDPVTNELIKFSLSPGARIVEYDKSQATKEPQEESIILTRNRFFDLQEKRLHIVNLSISFENILATMPLIGHPYPSYQHIGSIDAVVTLSMMTKHKESIQALSNFYSIVEDQAFKFRQIPQGQRNITVNSPLVNLVGLVEFIPENLTISTVPGQPGTYSAVLTLINNPLTSKTLENFSRADSFTVDSELRKMVHDVLMENIKIDKSRLNKGDITKKVAIKDSWKEAEARIEATKDISDISERLAARKWSDRFLKIAGYEHSIKGLYYYAPKQGEDLEGRDHAFKKICMDYADAMSFALAEILPAVHKGSIDEYSPNLRAFLAFNDADVLGIERFQTDLVPILQQIPRVVDSSYNDSLDPKGNPSIQYIREQHQKLFKSGSNSSSVIEEIRKWKTYAKEQENGEHSGLTDRVATKISGELRDRYLSADRFTNNYLRAWMDKSTEIIDKILLGAGDYLPQFNKVRAAKKAAFLKSSGHTYPDFPLDQIVDALRSGESVDYKLVLKKLEAQEAIKGYPLNSVGPASLIGPDFYFFNKQEIMTERILPYAHVKKASEAIMAIHTDKRAKAEEDWFGTVYNEEILGGDRTQIIDRQLRSKVDTDIWGKEVGKDIPDKGYEKAREALQANIESIIGMSDQFYEGDLMGNTTGGVAGLGSTIGTLAANQGLEEYQPMKVKKIDSSVDNQNHIGKERKDETMSVNDQLWKEVRHRFGPDSIAFLGQAAYSGPPSPKAKPGKDPQFERPIPIGQYRITSPWNPQRISPTMIDKRMEQLVKEIGVNKSGKELESIREEARNVARLEMQNNPHAIVPHFAVDYGRPSGTKGNILIPIHAVAEGTIVKVVLPTPTTGSGQDKKYGVAGDVVIRHTNNWYSMYRHLKDDDVLHALYARWHKNKNLKITHQEVIGTMGNTGPSTGLHLHFEIWKGGRKSGRVNPEAVFSGQFAAAGDINIGIDPQNESLLTKSVEQLEKDLQNSQGYTMARAYPTFRLYFIESDSGERKKFGFDDFFKYSSVKEIQLIRSRKIAADLLALQLTNVSGVLSNRKFQATGKDPDKPRDNAGNVVEENPFNPQLRNTVQENPVASMMLQPGVQIQLRLGYNSNPEELEIVFNGIITDVQFTESDDLVQLICQSFAVELVQNSHGDVKTFGGFLSSSGRTGEILEDLMAAPEVVHFGRWKSGVAQQGMRPVLTKRWTFVPQPQDDNIFAPSGRGIWGLFDTTPKYLLYHSTIWDVFMEMMLRHPSYVALPVPYQSKDGSARMTMFFGLPDQLYFARDPSYQEDNTVAQMKQIVAEAKDRVKNNRTPVDSLTDPGIELDPEETSYLIHDIPDEKMAAYAEQWAKGFVRKFALDRSIIKPFRNYHVLTSTHHILMNNINSSLYNTFNTATLQYSGKNPAIEEETRELKFGSLETLTLKCDAALDDEDVRELYAQFPNCVGYEMAKRYGIGLLFHSLKEGYKGDIVIIGNPRIKPYDICYVFDEYSDMYGPVEVEQVVHKFSQQNGFITEITPDMVVHVNQHSTLSTSDAMGLMAEHALKRIGMQSLPSIIQGGSVAVTTGSALAGAGGIAAGTATAVLTAGAAILHYGFSPIANMFFNSAENALGTGGDSSFYGMLGTFIFRKQITRTQLAHPFRYSPLVKNGRAMLGGLPSRKMDGSFIQRIDGFFKDFDNNVPLYLEDLYDKINPNRWLGQSTGDFGATFLGNT